MSLAIFKNWQFPPSTTSARDVTYSPCCLCLCFLVLWCLDVAGVTAVDDITGWGTQMTGTSVAPGLLASTATAGGGDKWWGALLGRESEPQATLWLGESGSQDWLSLLLSSLWSWVPLQLGGQSYTATQHNYPCCLQSLWCCGLSLHN